MRRCPVTADWRCAQPRSAVEATHGRVPAGVDILILILLVAAAVMFGLAAFGVGGRINLIALGLLCWVLTQLLPAIN